MRLLPKALRWLSAFIFITFALEVTTVVLSQNSINNLILFHLHTVVEVVMLSLLFQFLLKGAWLKTITWVFIIAFVLFAIIYPWYYDRFGEFNSLQRGVQGIAMIILCIVFLLQLISRLDVERLSDYPYFWLFSGLMIYFSGTFFLFLYSNKYFKLGNMDYWFIHSLLNIFLNFIFAITLWKGRKWTS